MALPLPQVVSDVGPGGSVVTGMRGQNALGKDMMTNAYYPASQEAQIAAQQAYAQNLPLQNLATVLSNPNLYAAADKGVVNSLLNRYAQMAANPTSSQPSVRPNPLSTGVFSRLMNMMGGGDGQNANAINQNQPMQQQGGYAPQQQPQQQQWQPQQEMAPAPSSPLDMIPSANQSSTTGLPSTKVERIAAAGGAGDTKYGGVNPSTIAGAQTKGLEATASGEASSQVDQQKTTENNDIDAANEAIAQKQLLTKARELHGKIPQWQRGKVFGNITPDILTGSEATELDTTMQNIVASVKKQQESGNAGVEGIRLATSSKPNRSMPDAAFNHLIDYNDAMNERILEKPSFNQAMFGKGYTPAQVATMWLYYQSERPFYDSSHHIKDDANIDSWDKFYATPGRRDAAFSPTAAKKIKEVMGEGKQGKGKQAVGQSQDEGMVDMSAQAPVEGVVQEVRTLNGKQAVKINGEWHWKLE